MPTIPIGCKRKCHAEAVIETEMPACLCLNVFMRTTVDLSDDLFRRAKAEAALRGRKFKDLVEEGLRHVLEQPELSAPATAQTSLHDLMQDCCGVAEPTPADYASNAVHLEGFGN